MLMGRSMCKVCLFQVSFTDEGRAPAEQGPSVDGERSMWFGLRPKHYRPSSDQNRAMGCVWAPSGNTTAGGPRKLTDPTTMAIEILLFVMHTVIIFIALIFL